MRVFVGLGNPGQKYQNNRHNIGFMAMDAIAREHGFSPWRQKFQAQICDGQLGIHKVLLIKPETFMNLSGQSVGEAMRFYKLASSDITVFHDELDLAPSKCRVKMGGGHAGHNGLRSIHQHIGPEYERVRLGIGHPGRKELVAHYVLHDFAREDSTWLDPLLSGIASGAPKLTAQDAGGFMNKVALHVQEAPETAPAPNKTEKPTASKNKKEEDSRSPLQKLLDKFK